MESFRLGEYQFLSLLNNDLALRSNATFQSLISKALRLPHSDQETRTMAIFAEGSEGALVKANI